MGISAVIGSIVCILVMLSLQFIIGKKMSENYRIIAVSVRVCSTFKKISTNNLIILYYKYSGLE